MKITSTTILKGALDIIQTKGWCQGEFKNRKGACCIIGALREADAKLYVGPTVECPFSPAYMKARDRLRRALNPKHNIVITWNDKPGRTQKQVENALKKALKVRA